MAERAATPEELRPTRAERRHVLVAGAVFFGVLVVLVIAAAVANPTSDPPPTTTTASTQPCATDDIACLEAERAASPNIIPKPNEGVEPTRGGDRGGWEQVATLAAIVLGLAALAALAVRSARRNRRREETG